MADLATKRCTGCGAAKALTEFGVYSSAPDGHAWRCRDCTRQADRTYRETNRDAVAANKRRYRAEHLEWAREQSRLYRERHADRVREGQRRRYAEWRDQVFAHYGTACACCGVSDRLTIDHVDGGGGDHRQQLRGKRGGGGGAWFYRWLIRQGFPDGYQTLCQPCNRSKGAQESCSLQHDPDGELARDLLRRIRHLESVLMGESRPHTTLLNVLQILQELEAII